MARNSNFLFSRRREKEQITRSLLKPPVVETDEVNDLAEFESTSNSEIKQVLQEFDQLKACVRQDGVVFYVQEQLATRPFERLIAVVRRVYGEAHLEVVSHSQFSLIQAKIASSKGVSSSDPQRTNSDALLVLQAAVKARASDVYLLLHREVTQVRFRVHGLIYEYARYSALDGKHMVRALWSMADSGQFDMETPTDCIFDYDGWRIRGNSLPDTRGCSVVLRLRDPHFRLSLDSLGYEKQQLSTIKEIFSSPHGLTVIGGTTNSGKSTTLTALMASIENMQHVIEIADPIEIEFEHITHSEINNYAEDSDETFRAKLAALVRQNPDVLFLGEIRDEDSATAAVHMAMQGKKVWSTVHTGDCASTLTRLEILGIQHHQLIAPHFLNGIINQSLIPLLCQRCAQVQTPAELKQHVLSELGEHFDEAEVRFIIARDAMNAITA